MSPAAPVRPAAGSGRTPVREVITGDALPWLRTQSPRPGACVVTSLPDLSEVRMGCAIWSEWFVEAATRCIRLVPDDGAALFFQTDVRHDGRWIDKGALVLRAAEAAGALLLFHKIVCRFQPGHVTGRRPGYTHLMAVSRALRSTEEPGLPDVIVDAGRPVWVRAMGPRAAAHAIRFARIKPGRDSSSIRSAAWARCPPSPTRWVSTPSGWSCPHDGRSKHGDLRCAWLISSPADSGCRRVPSKVRVMRFWLQFGGKAATFCTCKVVS